MLGGQKLPVQPGKLVMLARKEWSKKCAEQTKPLNNFCRLCWQPITLPALTGFITASFPSGKTAKVRVTQDLISMGFKVRWS